MFFERESCGKCTPCREGVGWLRSILQRLAAGRGQAGDMELLGEVAGKIRGYTFCALGDGAAAAVLAFVGHFREDFERKVSGA